MRVTFHHDMCMWCSGLLSSTYCFQFMSSWWSHFLVCSFQYMSSWWSHYSCVLFSISELLIITSFFATLCHLVAQRIALAVQPLAQLKFWLYGPQWRAILIAQKRSFCVQADRHYVNDIFTASLNYSSERKQERSLVSWSMAKQKMSFDFVLKFVWKFCFTICSTEVCWYSKLSQILIPISFSAFLHHGSFRKLGDCLVIWERLLLLTASRANDLCASAYSNDKVKQLWTSVGHKYKLLQFLEFMNHEGRWLLAGQ